MDDSVRKNRELWDEWADINYASAFYDVAGFKRDPRSLDPIIIDSLGPLAGKSLLHLQCHFGMDTLRLARLGATVTGVDFSPKAIAYARRLADETGIAAAFVESDVYALALDQRFDVVFTAEGVLSWLPDLAAWGEVIARHLAPGGTFFLHEAHPASQMFDLETGTLALRYPYFKTAEPLVFPPVGGNYADPNATRTKTEYAWPHALAEIFDGLRGAGLAIDRFAEYPHSFYQAFSMLVEREGRWHMPPDQPAIPLSFALRARHAGNGS
jgi:2-polyprenyl-3-methyl-5-hydroxy-6-metoxy-1,4-benzoquinol methylase